MDILEREERGMHLITRRHGERIVVVRDGAVVFAVGIDLIEGDRVRLGVSPQDAFDVYREEVWEQIKREEEGEDFGEGG